MSALFRLPDCIGAGVMFVRISFLRKIAGHRNPLGAASIVALVVGISAVVSPASAQTIVPDGTNLATLSPPVATDVWNLQGNAALFDPAGAISHYALSLPDGLTVNGVAGGSTLMLDDEAGHAGYFTAASGATLNLSNIIISGAENNASGGAIVSTGALTLNTSGLFAMTNDETTVTGANGGVISSGGVVTIVGGRTANGDGTPTTLIIEADDSPQSGGAISAAGIALTGAFSSIRIANNTNSDLGGSFNGSVFYTGGQVSIAATVIGDFTLSDNWAGSNGAFWASQGVVIGPATVVGGTMAFTNNAGNAGGAIYTDATISIGGSYGDILIADNMGRAGRGGALRANTSLTIDTTVAGTLTVTGNSATGDGGAFAATGGFVTIIGSYGGIEFSHNASDVAGYGAAGTQCGGGGGAICAGNGSVTIIASVTDTMAFAYNTAVDGNGGAIAAANGNVVLDAGPGNISLTGNIAGGTNFVGHGGAIYSTGTATITGNALTMSGNIAVAGAGGAVYALGDLTLNSAATMTISDNSTGLHGGALRTGGNATLNAGSDVSLTGNTATAGEGGAIYSTGMTTITGNAITISGNTATAGAGGAIYAGGDVTIGDAGSALMLTGNSAGGDGGGIWSGGSVNVMGTTISNNTAAGNGGAIYAAGDFSLTSTTADTISNNSAGGTGGAIWAGGNATLNAAAGNMTFSGNSQGAGANAIYMDNTGGGATLALNTNGNAITFFDPIQNNAANGLVSVFATGGGTVAFDGSLYSNLTDRWSQLYGNTDVQSGTTFVVQNNAVYGALAADVGQTTPSNFTLASGAALAGGIAGEVRADSVVLGGTFDISGNTVLGRPAGGPSTFVITSNNVTFGAGSQVLFNTYAGQLADLLILNLNGSATTGTAGVVISSTAGLGAATVGNGIQLVQTNNGTSTGAFTLVGNQLVVGAYEYMLFQGGVGVDAGNQNWYLRTTSMRPEVPTDTVVPALASRLGLAMLGTADSRNGYGVTQFCGNDVEAGRSGLYTKARSISAQCNTLLWGRVFGVTGSAGSGVSTDGAFGNGGPAYGFDYGGFQAGADFYRTARDNAGLYASAATAHADVRALAGAGSAGRVNMDAYGFGGYWTHRHPNGWYTDLVLQGNWYENIHARSVAGLGLDTHGWGITASAEAGYTIALGDGYSVIPQGQLIYQRTDIRGGADPFAQISFGTTDEIYARLGGRFAKDWLVNDGRAVTSWAETNIWHQFGGDATTAFANLQGTSPTTFAASLGGTWAQIGLGISGQLTRKVSIFGNADYNIALNQPGHSLGGRAGLRVNW